MLRGDTRIAANADLDPWDDQILPRDGTTIAATEDLDSWDVTENIRFLFGYAAYDVLKARADELPEEAYGFLERPPQYTVRTAPRQQPERVQPAIVRGVASRRSICSKRRLPSSTIGRSPARRAIG